jgi:hypothetical protein
MVEPFMDALKLLRLLVILCYLLTRPVLHQLASSTSRSSTAGFVLLLLMVTSMIETFLLSLFYLIKLSLIAALAYLFGAELLRWLVTDVPQNEGNIREVPYQGMETRDKQLSTGVSRLSLKQGSGIFPFVNILSRIRTDTKSNAPDVTDIQRLPFSKRHECRQI